MSARNVMMLSSAAALLLLATGCSDDTPPPRRTARRPPEASADAPAHRAPQGRRPRPDPGEVPLDVSTLPLPGQSAAPPPPEKLVPGPWASAKEGDRVKYHAKGGCMLTYTVVQADGETVTVEVAVSFAGLGSSTRMTFQRIVPAGQALDRVPPSAVWSEEDVNVDGRDFPCRVATWCTGNGGDLRTLKVYLSDAVPGRLVRSVEVDSSGRRTVTMDLVQVSP